MMSSDTKDSADLIRLRYQNEISVFPPELQTAAGVLYAIVRSVVQHDAISDNSCDDFQAEAHDSHHFMEGRKLNRLQTLGPDATFLSLIQQANQDIESKDNTAVIEVSDGMGMRMAKARDFISGRTGSFSYSSYCLFLVSAAVILKTV